MSTKFVFVNTFIFVRWVRFVFHQRLCYPKIFYVFSATKAATHYSQFLYDRVDHDRILYQSWPHTRIPWSWHDCTNRDRRSVDRRWRHNRRLRHDDDNINSMTIIIRAIVHCFGRPDQYSVFQTHLIGATVLLFCSRFRFSAPNRFYFLFLLDFFVRFSR